jgi:ABC-type branched-subunit amino acid transport system substrate-binding protein
VTRAGLEGADWYFAFSMPYRDQGRLLAQYVKRHFGNQRVAAIVTNTPNFDDAVQGWEQGVQEQGLEYYRTLRHPRGDESWYNTFARELAQNDVDVVYILTAPVSYLRFAQQARQQDYTPQFVGVGITMGLNPLLESGCDNNTLDGGIFFSPFPGLDWARQNAPDFFRAAQRFGTPDDDLAFAIWGQARAMHDLFQRYEQHYGTDLTREEFRHFVERQQDVAGQVFPPVSYTPDDHFGARQVHVLQADCSTQEHKTLQTFQSSF